MDARFLVDRRSRRLSCHHDESRRRPSFLLSLLIGARRKKQSGNGRSGPIIRHAPGIRSSSAHRPSFPRVGGSVTLILRDRFRPWWKPSFTAGRAGSRFDSATSHIAFAELLLRLLWRRNPGRPGVAAFRSDWPTQSRNSSIAVRPAPRPSSRYSFRWASATLIFAGCSSRPSGCRRWNIETRSDWNAPGICCAIPR